MLEHEETMSLLKQAKDGDDNAKEKLIEENLPLIKSIAKRFKGRLEYDDIMQLGALGFVKAINGFDESFGVRFSTYAVPMIAGEIKRFLRDDGQIKVSRCAKILANKISKYVDKQLKDGQKEPTIDELAKVFDVDKSDIVFALDTSKFVLSLSDATTDDDTPLEDKIAGGDFPEAHIDEFMLKDSIMSLSDRDRKIIILRYFRDKTQAEVASELGVSQVQVSRLENKILQKIKSELE